MKAIKLTQNKMAIVDDDDFYSLSQFKWCFQNSPRGYGYAVRINKKRLIIMHRLIMNAKEGMEVDHINGNTLDNRRCNLRVCSPPENKRNRKINKGSYSGYKGVDFKKNRWRARIQINKKSLFLGCFMTKEEAAEAYNIAALKYHKEFACLNILGDKHD